MEFPDQSHINRVRDALWRPDTSRATVMVGSGFSKNASVLAPRATLPPGWSEVIHSMYAELYSPKQAVETSESFAADNALDIAQQYCISFGRMELHRFLGTHIQDDSIDPGEFHRRLLSLPWRDVFTTNWDTLLERTRDQVNAQTYEVVRVAEEIPLAAPPRIVKLHGSLPSNFPLVITEEDFRTYPSAFAPFVNTVQQAMMESVLLLIGFSGRDPNFLHWSGWVRDQLGSSAPQIYTAGWLGLSIHERRVLEAKNVVPIDLANHPKGKFWHKQDRDRIATEWILQTLELGQPYPSEEWPSFPKKPPDFPEHLKPLVASPWVHPAQETHSPPNPDSQNLKEEINNQLDIWSRNRKLYPGWLYVPTNRQAQLGLTTKRWEETILNHVGDLDSVERLWALFEMMWRCEIALIDPGPNLANAAEATLREIVGFENEKVDVAKTIEAVSCVAIGLVRHARLSVDKRRFEESINLAESLRGQDSEFHNSLQYEKCLWSLYRLDLEGLESRLAEWNLDSGDPFWKSRAATLMLVLGKRENARSLSKTYDQYASSR